jgi:hypothetical protein
MDPNIERILDMGFSPPKDPKNLYLEEKKNSYLDVQATYVLLNVVSSVVSLAIMPFRSAHELWRKLQEKYDVSKIIEDIIFLPLQAVTNFLPLHQCVEIHKVMIW